nr:hypothetical protein [Tanacetum cinerariifolium]
MLKSFSLPVKKIPLPEYFPTASEERLSQRDAPAEEVCTAEKLKERQLLKHRVQDSLSYKRSLRWKCSVKESFKREKIRC